MLLGQSTELTLLVASVVVGLVQLVWASAAGYGGGRDMPYLLGPRDEDRPIQSVTARRLVRAYRNFMETFPLFAGALLAALMVGKAGPLTLWGSWLYFAGRVVYAPLYAVGLRGVRTLVWTVSMVGIVLIVLAFFR